MNLFIWVTLAGVATAVLGIVGGTILLFSRRLTPSALRYLVSFAAGAMLGVSFLDLMPESSEALGAMTAGRYALWGLLLFFVAEKFLLWHHHGHATADTSHVHAAGPLLVIGDTLHNFLDGIIIAVTFTASVSLGIATTIAIIMHEIPQEVGDFAVLLDSGMERKKVLLYNLLSGLATVLGAWLLLLVGPSVHQFSYKLVAVAAGIFIYIAAADLIPQIHHESNRRRMLYQVLAMAIGLALISSVVAMAGE